VDSERGGGEMSESVLLKLTADIVSAHLKRNVLPAERLPELIREVHGALSRLGEVTAPAQTPMPAVPIRKSVHPDYLICLEDGKKLKLLRRHLKTAYNMTPEEYRAKWNLPPDYPMVAPNYAEHRSSLARQVGLGQKPQQRVESEPVEVEPETVQMESEEEAEPSAPAPKRRGRKPKQAASGGSRRG
jgi:predicted transcriptional regulator